MQAEIDIESFVEAHAAGAFVIDVREPREYLAAHVPGAVPMPLAQVLARQTELPLGEPVYVICSCGDRSKTAVDWLRARRFDAVSVIGGVDAWVSSGHRTDSGTHP